jgi:hypothetical protein
MNPIDELTKQWIWLMENRYIRIKNSHTPDTIERVYHNVIFSANHKNTIRDLKADIEILEDRITRCKI